MVKILSLTATVLKKIAFKNSVPWYVGNEFNYKGDDVDKTLSHISILNTSQTGNILYCLDLDIDDLDIVIGNDAVGIIPPLSILTIGENITNIRLISDVNLNLEIIIE